MHGWTWGTNTGPFSALDDGDAPARFVIEQIDDACFRPLDGYGFRYSPPDGSAPIEVTAESLPRTDLASIPRFMSWFVSRYGRHTPAALVHDQLVHQSTGPAERGQADDRFVEMMEQLDVPPVRRTVMWAAVVLATRWTGGWSTRAATIIWGLAAACGLALLTAGVATARPMWCAVALVAPAPAAGLWGSRWRAGLVAGYALPPVVIPALTSALGYGSYWLVEEALRRVRSLAPSNDVDDLISPTPYKEL